MRKPVELDDVALRVIAEGRHAFEPSELVTARVRRAVEGMLAKGATAPTWQNGRGAPGWVRILVGAAAASVATAALAYVAWRPRPAVSPVAVSISAVSVKVTATAPAMRVSAAEPKPEPSLVPVAVDTRLPISRSSVVNASKSESLAEEVELLVSVNSAIQSHQGAQALRLLRLYDQQFKKPQLREERAAAGVLALCAAGRVEAARGAAKHFQSTWSRSPLTARVVNSCIANK